MGASPDKTKEEYAISLYEICNGSAREAERYSQEHNPKISLCYHTFIKYWKQKGLKTKTRGGPNSLGKHWKQKIH